MHGLSLTVVAFAAIFSSATCQKPVKTISFTEVTNSGSFNAVTSFENGQCQQEPFSFNGPIAPLNEEVTLFVRGPIQFTQFAVYTPTTNNRRKREAGPSHRRSHGHRYRHRRSHRIDNSEGEEKRQVGEMVTAVIDGMTVSWVNNYGGAAAPTATSSLETSSPSTASTTSIAQNTYPTSTADADPSSEPDPSSSWARSAYYSSSAQEADGLVFLKNPPYSSMLSYSSANGTSTSSSPEILSDTYIPSNNEFMIWTDAKCQGNDCAYTASGSAAYHGFPSSNNIAFFFEFSMPDDTGAGGNNPNLPAIWMLNSRIPRVQQYGTCTCWTNDGSSGCGEYDLFEANPTNGPDMLLPMFHCMGTKAGGSLNSDYFERPYIGTMKAAVVFCHGQQAIQMQVLDNSTDISNVSGNTIDQICLQSSFANVVNFDNL